jgi:hypothetical protein
MEDLNNLLEKRGVKQVSRSFYVRNLNRISEGINNNEYTNNTFLKNTIDVMRFIQKHSVSVQKNFISSVLVAISFDRKALPGFEKAYEIYNVELKKLYSDNALPEGKKTPREAVNWLSWTDILKIVKVKANVVKKLGLTASSKNLDISKSDFLILQEYIVLALYTMLPPNRLIYGITLIITEKDYKKLSEAELKNNAYLVVKNTRTKYFSFGIETLKSPIGIDKLQIVDVPKDLNSVLNTWLNYNKSGFLLLNEHDNILTRNGLTRLLLKIFNPYHRDISASMLRKIYISHQDQDDFVKNAKKVERSRLMNHSVKTASKNYLKQD